jgi:DNA recombination protein RmuC
MELIYLTAILFLLLALAAFINKKFKEIAEKQKPSKELLEIINILKDSSQEDRKILLSSLQKNTQALNERLDTAARVISEVQKNVGEMSEIGRSMKDLQEFLKSPKIRGNIGEQVLIELLSQYLPKHSFHIQYSFKSGEKVDAAIKTTAGIVPVDSKFPMENFRKMSKAENDSDRQVFQKEFERDVKKHIDNISKKYILTEEGTIDYALMYVQSESVYYEIVNNSKLFDYAGEKRVLPVSPTTFYAYMRAILMSFEGQKIELRAREILYSIRAVQKDYLKVDDNLKVMQKHLTNAYNMMENVQGSFKRLGSKISSTQKFRVGKTKDELNKLKS